jgi:hypothetical protein
LAEPVSPSDVESLQLLHLAGALVFPYLKTWAQNLSNSHVTRSKAAIFPFALPFFHARYEVPFLFVSIVLYTPS